MQKCTTCEISFHLSELSPNGSFHLIAAFTKRKGSIIDSVTSIISTIPVPIDYLIEPISICFFSIKIGLLGNLSQYILRSTHYVICGVQINYI